MSLDLRKKKVLDLKKQIGLDGAKAQVVIALDFSGSMYDMYRDWTVQKTLERLFPLALGFDDDGAMPFYLFSYGCKRLADVTASNFDKFVKTEVDRTAFEMRGTEYAPVLKKIKSEFSDTGFLGTGTPKKEPVYVIFVTDGNCDDESETVGIIRELSKRNVFVQFVGIGRERFQFLQLLDNVSGRFIDNANFLKIDNLDRVSDEDLYAGLMEEFPAWLEEAKKHSLIA